MKTFVFMRCDGGVTLGMGHVMRCIALGHMLKKHFTITFLVRATDNTVYDWIQAQGFECTTLSRHENAQDELKEILQNVHDTAASMIVLDGYQFKTDYQQRLLDAGVKVIAIDDLHDWYHPAHAIINHAPNISPSAYQCAPTTRLLLGCNYAMLRPELLAAAAKPRTLQQANSFMISMGAADVHNHTEFFARILSTLYPGATLHLLVSSLNPHLTSIEAFYQRHATQVQLHLNLASNQLTSLLLRVDAVVCPASTIALEACATGCTLITGYSAANQQGILAGLIERQAAFSLGAFENIDESTTRDTLAAWMNDTALRRNQLEQQRMLIDGKSGYRLVQSFMELAKDITVRKANADDVQLYFDWANDPQVRANSFQTSDITWSEHESWFRCVLNNSANTLYLYSIGEKPASQMRLKLDGNTATINYSVSTDFRGQGLGTWLLMHIALKTRIELPEVKTLIGWVKKNNIPSLRAFEKAGYSVTTESEDSFMYSLDLSTL
jgi:UDP-2,4-diacetamido-2,4,6-trideoxy-beta-L-altropyranose hydrolase